MNPVDDLFQERVDELLLLEQRADRRAEELMALTSDYHTKSQQALDGLLNTLGGLNDSLSHLNAAADQVGDYVTHSAQQALRTARLFLGTVVACALLVAGTLWWSHHVTDGLTAARAELAGLEVKLTHTPVIMQFKGKDYVRVVPDSETGFTRGDGGEVPGRYAAVWHVR